MTLSCPVGTHFIKFYIMLVCDVIISLTTIVRKVYPDLFHTFNDPLSENKG